VAVGKPGVPSWAAAPQLGADAAGGRQQRRSDPTDPIVPEEWAGHIGGSSRAQATLSRLLAYTLWGGIAIALALGLVNCAGRPAAAPPVAGTPEPAPPIAPPGGCAELVVSAWLAGDTATLANVAGMPRADPEPGRRQATRTYIASVTPGDGAWAYLIGADVQARDEQERWQPAGTQFFTVTMVPTAGGCQGWGPAALPAQAAAPQLALADEAASPYEVSLPTSGTELSTTLDAFFAGLLAGAENLDRYVSPGVSIAAVIPPPYEQVSVTELHARDDPTERGATVPPDGTVLQLLATVASDATDATVDDLPLVYPVTVAVRGGRWEVVAIDPLVGTTVADAPETPDPAETTNGG
jgi:hypothetical protein